MISNQPAYPASSSAAADDWFTPGRFAALLGLFIALTFPGILLGQETFFYRDFGVFGYPLAHYQRECFWRGELPLWNPLSSCGLPFLAQWNTLCLYPPALFYLLFPLSWSLGVFNVAHLFLAGMGMYFLARKWVGNNLAAAVAGVAFAFNGLTWHSLMWPNDIAGLAWMPWVVLTAERAWREGGRGCAWAGLTGAMQMLSGAPEIILLTWLLAGAIWLGQFFDGKINRRRMFVRFAAITILIAGIAAAQLLPFLDLLAHSQRDTGFSGNADWSMPLSGPANFLVPMFHSFAAGHGVFVQYEQYWIASYYLGAGLLLLGFAGAWGAVRNRRVWLLLAMAMASVLMALGNHGHVYSLLKTIVPQLGFIRYPIKFVVPAVFIIPILAAYGVRWLRSDNVNSPRAQKTTGIITVVLLAVIGAIVWRAREHQMVSDDWSVTWRNALSRAAFLAAVPALLIGLGRARRLKLQIALRAFLLLLLWLDVYTGMPSLTPLVNRSVFNTGLIRTKLNLPPQPEFGESRFMQTTIAMDKTLFISLPDPANDYLCHRLSFFDDCNLLDDVAKVDGFYSLYLHDAGQVISLLYRADVENVDTKNLKDFLGVGHINPPGTNQNIALEWVARDTAMPLVTAGQKPIFVSATNLYLTPFQTNFNPREMVYLSEQNQPEVTARFTPDAKIISQHLEGGRLRAETDSPAVAMVVIAQAFYHPWRAYVDGARVKLWEANGAFQALQVPAGRHQVLLVYEDQAFNLGLVISLASIAVAVAIITVRRHIAVSDGKFVGILSRGKLLQREPGYYSSQI